MANLNNVGNYFLHRHPLSTIINYVAYTVSEGAIDSVWVLVSTTVLMGAWDVLPTMLIPPPPPPQPQVIIIVQETLIIIACWHCPYY
jgi:hypothetical protein